MTEKERDQLKCRSCGSWLLPHVLWFDETYNEHQYRYQTALETPLRTHLLITVGTTGATSLPNHIVHLVHLHGGRLVDINIAENSFSDLAVQSKQGVFIKCASSEALGALTRAFLPVQSNL